MDSQELQTHHHHNQVSGCCKWPTTRAWPMANICWCCHSTPLMLPLMLWVRVVVELGCGTGSLLRSLWYVNCAKSMPRPKALNLAACLPQPNVVIKIVGLQKKNQNKQYKKSKLGSWSISMQLSLNDSSNWWPYKLTEKKGQRSELNKTIYQVWPKRPVTVRRQQQLQLLRQQHPHSKHSNTCVCLIPKQWQQ